MLSCECGDNIDVLYKEGPIIPCELAFDPGRIRSANDELVADAIKSWAALLLGHPN